MEQISIMQEATDMPTADGRQPPPEWIDENLVAQSLRKVLGDQGLMVDIRNVSYACSPGTGLFSEMFRVTADTRSTRQSERRQLTVKIFCRNGALVEVIQEANLFFKETVIYTEILPAIEVALKPAEGNKWRPLAPRCYHRGLQPTNFLVLEDLLETRFQMAEESVLLDHHHCSLLLRSLARFHASTLLLVDNESLADASFALHTLLVKKARAHYSVLAEKYISMLADNLETQVGYEKFAQKCRQQRLNILDRLETALSSCQSQLKVMLHGDLWKNNVMFKYSDGCPVEVRIIDFQNCHWGSPAFDIQHFLSSSASLDVQQHHLDSLLLEYHGTLQGTLRALGLSKQADGFPFQQLRSEMEQLAIHGLCVAIMLTPILLSPQSLGEHMENDDDHDAYVKKEVGNPDFISFMKCLLPAFEKAGVL